jgi:hypothetical protein
VCDRGNNLANVSAVSSVVSSVGLSNLVTYLLSKFRVASKYPPINYISKFVSISISAQN